MKLWGKGGQQEGAHSSYWKKGKQQESGHSIAVDSFEREIWTQERGIPAGIGVGRQTDRSIGAARQSPVSGSTYVPPPDGPF